MNKTNTKRLGIVGLKALDHKFDRCVVHIRQRKIRHIKYHTRRINGIPQHQPCSLHDVDGISFQTLFILICLTMKTYANEADGTTLAVAPVEETLSHPKLLHKALITICDRSVFAFTNNLRHLMPKLAILNKVARGVKRPHIHILQSPAHSSHHHHQRLFNIPLSRA